MSGRRANMLDIREILRRVRLGESDRAIVKALGVSRKTVRKYREWAEQAGLPAGELPSTEQLTALLQTSLPEAPPPQAPSAVEPYRELVVRWREQGLECQAIWQRLRRDHGFKGAYSAVWRFVSHLEAATPNVTVRIEVKPGDEAQVDFGYVGLLLDPATGRRRKAWAFVMTLSWSCHMYVEFVFDQTVETWLRLHQHAFAFFGAVPRRIVLDNLKAAIVKACFEDPVVQRSYRELAEHYGFLLAPCRVRTPEHKGKVENGVHYVQRNLSASHDFADIHAANQGALVWIEQLAGQRIHGTTRQKPLVQFQEVEQAAMLPLPGEPYDLAVWKQVTRGPGLLRQLREGVLLGAVSPGRPASVGARRLDLAAHLRQPQPGGAPTHGPSSPANVTPCSATCRPRKWLALRRPAKPVRRGRPKSAPAPPKSSPACWPRSRSTACRWCSACCVWPTSMAPCAWNGPASGRCSSRSTPAKPFVASWKRAWTWRCLPPMATALVA